jgi:hypothetical protein
MSSWISHERSHLPVSPSAIDSPAHFTNSTSIKSVPSGHLGMCRSNCSLRIRSDISFSSYDVYGWPARSVERLPSYTPVKLKTPVLVIGNMVRASHPRITFLHGLTAIIHRPTQSPHSRARNMLPACSATTPSWSSNLASVTRLSLRPRHALWALCSITSQLPRSVFSSSCTGFTFVLNRFVVV